MKRPKTRVKPGGRPESRTRHQRIMRPDPDSMGHEDTPRSTYQERETAAVLGSALADTPSSSSSHGRGHWIGPSAAHHKPQTKPLRPDFSTSCT